MKASDLFVKCLENENVEYIFGIPGEENIDFLDSLSKSKIKFIPTRHEQGAAFMADVYGRLTGKPGVCLSTLGPGATNLITGVADANLDRVPLVALTAQGSLETTHKESHQYIDVVQTFKSITKWNRTIVRADFIPEMVRKAFKIAKAEKPGATHIELPEDVAKEETNAEPLSDKTVKNVNKPDIQTIKKTSFLIKNSKYPIIIAGNGVIRANASKELLDFATKNNISVVNTFMGKGVISSKNKLNIGTVGLQSYDYVMCGLHRADLVITIGYDVVEYSPSLWNPKRNKKILHIDSKYSEVDQNYRTTIDLVGEIKETLKLLNKYTGFKKNPHYSFKLREFMQNELHMYRESKSFPMKPQKIISDIRDSLADDDIVLSDVGAHKLWVARLYPAYKPNTTIISNGFASMGIALPGAIAAKLVYPKKKVVAVIGDGGFLMNVQELETAKRLGTNFVVVIFNDSKYSLIEWKQLIEGKKSFGVDFTNPDFVKLAESFGIKGVKIKKAEEFKPTLQKALRDKNIWIIDVNVDISENLKLTKKLGANICPV